jgi:hypothetical protein
MKTTIDTMEKHHANFYIKKQASQWLLAEKLAHYSRLQPTYFLQLDGTFAPRRHDETKPFDIEGDSFEASRTVELMLGSSVRVLIPQETHLKGNSSADTVLAKT